MIRFVLIIIITLLIPFKSLAQSILKDNDEKSIIGVLKAQQNAWNEGNIEEFMKGYIKSKNLVFNSSTGPHFGWLSVRDRYKWRYPTKERMGKLTFKVQKISSVSENVAQLLGKFNLFFPSKCFKIFKNFKNCEDQEINGFFTLLWVKTENGWLILSDHTSRAD